MIAKRLLIPLLLLTSVHFAGQLPVYAQDALYLVNSETTVSKISFKFPEGNSPFEPATLLPQLVTTAPTFWDRFNGLNPFRRQQTYPFDPIELQKDVVRLRQFYQRNGFPTPRVLYSASQYDVEENQIHVIFAVWQGEPQFLEAIRVMGPDSTNIVEQLPDGLQSDWRKFSRSLSSNTGKRFTVVEQVRIQDLILKWFQNHGYAFARVEAQSNNEGARRDITLTYLVDAGPMGFFSSIDVEGNETVSNQVLLRELPFEIGERYSVTKLREGQQQLFGLNLFRVALADVPEQPVDSTVQVRLRVNEANRRYLSAETGYSRQEGLGLEGEWTHRNFLGSARNLSVNLRANTGLLGNTGSFTASNVVGKLPARLFRTSVSLRQPYLFTTRLSGIFAPFIEFQNDPQLAASNEFLDINRREFGLNATLIYEVLPFRPISLQYTLSQSLSRLDLASLSTLSRDIYSKSVLAVSATFGKTDNYLNPRQGFLFKPVLETAGRLFSSGVQYNKVGFETTGYIPLNQKLMLSGRLFAGKLWTFGDSNEALANRICIEDAALTGAATDRCLLYENRFDPIFFYAGGGNDVRGWDFQLLGPKIARADTSFVDGAVETDPTTGDPIFNNFFYERTGGTSKLIGNIEARMRIPGFGPAWQGATFFDFGQVSNGAIRLRDFRYNIGAGLRYRTVVGFIRVDLAYKLNPTNADLTNPEDAFLFENGFTSRPPDEKFFRRFGLHISIGQAF